MVLSEQEEDAPYLHQYSFNVDDCTNLPQISIYPSVKTATHRCMAGRCSRPPPVGRRSQRLCSNPPVSDWARSCPSNQQVGNTGTLKQVKKTY